MRISTNQIHQRGLQNILRQQSQLSTDQEHIASGKRIQSPSDDPIGASKVISLKEQVALSDRLQENAGLAKGRLEFTDSVLDSIVNSLQRVRELTIQGANDTNGPHDREAIAIEIESRLNEIAGLINSTDGNGDYLFAGYQSRSEPFNKLPSGSYVYSGDDGQMFSEISPGLSIPISNSGMELFATIPTGNGTFSVSENGAPNTGSAVVKETGVSGQAAYVADTYTMTFVTNSSGQIGVQVVGATSGQVVPPLPAVIPGAAPTFVSGQAIDFNGLQLTVEGTPQAGDDFLIKPSTKQNILTAIQNVVSTMRSDATTANGKTQFRNQLNQALPGLDQTIDKLISARIGVGSRLNTIDSVKEMNEDFIVQAKTVVSKIEDLDYAQAITEFESRSVALQAAQQTFMRIRNLSLFNYLQ